MKNKIGYKLVIAIVLFSSFITLITTALQIYMDYNVEIKKINDYETLIKESYLKSISSSVWSYDEIQIDTQLKGILHIPNVEYLEIILTKDKGARWSVGSVESENTITKEFSLWYNNNIKTINIGVLRAVISLDAVYSGLFIKAIEILISNAIQIFIISGFMLFIVQYLLTRHLYALSCWLRIVDIGKSFEKFELDRASFKSGINDELDEVVLAINQMQENLKTYLTDLTKSENKYKILTENIPLKIFHKDTNSVYVACNQNYAEDLNIESDQIVGKTDFDFFPKELAAKYRSDDHHIMESKKIELFEEQYIAPGREEVTIRTIKAPIWDSNSNVIGLIGAFTDITELKMTKKALLQSERKFSRLIEGLQNSHFFYSHDTSGHFTYLSSSITNILGYSDKEFLEHYTRYLTDNPINQEAVLHTEMAIMGVQQPPYEVEMLHKDGSIRRLQLSEAPVFDQDGKAVAVEGIAHDITEIKKIEDQLRQAQKMEAIGALAGGIAHDFNNILNVILGYAEIAKDDALPESSMVENLSRVIQAGERAKDLISQILAFSRQSEHNSIPFQPASIVKEVVKMLRHAIPSTIEIHENIDPNSELILADPIQIHQILMNLCTNAFHAMEHTGGDLFISLQNRKIDSEDPILTSTSLVAGKYVELRVRDTGPGISPAIQDKIFNPYFTTKEVGKGSGMGLSIVHGIVKSYGGAITVETTPEKGAAFYLFFPVAERGEAKEVIHEPVRKGSERILFVDDEDFLVNIGKKMLEMLGYKVTVKQSSIEAMELFQNQPDQFDLIITDQTMPVMTGADFARRILQIRPDMPIILCTGYSTIISEEKAKSMGIKAFALKPILQRDMSRLIRKVLDGS